jgi:hypothetical protein
MKNRTLYKVLVLAILLAGVLACGESSELGELFVEVDKRLTQEAQLAYQEAWEAEHLNSVDQDTQQNLDAPIENPQTEPEPERPPEPADEENQLGNGADVSPAEQIGEPSDQGDGQELSENQPSDNTHTPLECDGSGIVTITMGKPEKTKQGDCRYLVHYKNRSESKDINIYHFDTHTNPSTGLHHKWYREAALFAGNEYSEYQTVFTGGEASIAERVAIVFTSADCNWVGTDQKALDEIAQKLANPCDDVVGD